MMKLTKTQLQDEIAKVIQSIFSQGTFSVETFNEGLLVELMEANGTPIKNIQNNHRRELKHMEIHYDEVD